MKEHERLPAVDAIVPMLRELRALKAARAEEAKARVRALVQMKVLVAAQLDAAQEALDNAERDAKE